MGTVVSSVTAFGTTEVTYTVRQVPGPDRLNPYQAVIHAPYCQNTSGTVDGTRFDVTWTPFIDNGAPYPFDDSSKSSFFDGGRGVSQPEINSAYISEKELIMMPHDGRLLHDVDHDSGMGHGAWIRFQAKGPTGEVVQQYRIQVIEDPKGHLGIAKFAEAEVEAMCAPYLTSSLEDACAVQTLKRPPGDVYYCLLSNAAFAKGREHIASQFRYLFLGVFRISDSVAVVVGNLSEKDDVNYRMMMEALGKISTLPVVNGPGPEATP